MGQTYLIVALILSIFGVSYAESTDETTKFLMFKDLAIEF
jgi:hypothetical protein